VIPAMFFVLSCGLAPGCLHGLAQDQGRTLFAHMSC
jgi:hypothetical protein